MSRLAEYLARLADLLGHESNVHFKKLASGSAQICAFADEQALPKIKLRLDSLQSDSVSKPVAKARQDIDDLLFGDNAIGTLSLGSKKIFEFPGRRRPLPERIGPVRRESTVEGTIFQIGGKDETINVFLLDRGAVSKAVVSRSLARTLAPYLFGAPVRLFGQGDWVRETSAWRMESFTATEFAPLDQCDIHESLGNIRRLFEGVDPDTLLSDIEELRRG